MKLIKVRDESGDERYSTILTYPSSLSSVEATGIVDNAILRVKEENPDDYLWSDLMTILEPLGFDTAEWCFASQPW